MVAEMPNPNGNSASLVPQEGNAHAVKSGLYSRTNRILQPRAEEVAASLMQLPHASPLDAVAAEEIGSVVAALEAIDADLAARGTTRNGIARKSLLEHKARLTRELRTWLREFAATPKARFDFASRLTGATVADELRRRIGELE
jgi:hypothetical protein